MDIKAYLSECLKDKHDGWKRIILSSPHFTFIAERLMHLLDIRVAEADGKVIYECPHKSEDKDSTCYYCVCQRVLNCEIRKRQI